jgi:hypothetical protein
MARPGPISKSQVKYARLGAARELIEDMSDCNKDIPSPVFDVLAALTTGAGASGSDGKPR